MKRREFRVEYLRHWETLLRHVTYGLTWHTLGEFNDRSVVRVIRAEVALVTAALNYETAA